MACHLQNKIYDPATVLTFLISVTTISSILCAFHHIVVIIEWLSVSQDKINYRPTPTQPPPPPPPPLSPTTTTTITPLLQLLLLLPSFSISRSNFFPITQWNSQCPEKTKTEFKWVTGL